MENDDILEEMLLLNNGKVILFYRLYIYIYKSMVDYSRYNEWIHWKDRDYRL